MTRIVQRAAGSPLSEEAMDQLRRLASMPDEEIDLSDIPEKTFSASAAILRERHDHPSPTRKAS